MKKILVLISLMLITLMGTAAQSATITLNSSADTYLRADRGPFGSDVLMNIYGGTYDWSGYVRFDLSSLGAIEITEAAVTFTVTTGGARGDVMNTGRFALYALNNVAGNTPQNWDESTLTWNLAGDEWTGVVPMDLTDGRVVNLDGGTADVTEATNPSGGSSAAGTTVTVSGNDLAAFLQSRVFDGGLATLIATNPDSNLRAYALATKENTTDAGPSLQLTYTPIRHAYLPNPADGATVPLTLSELSWSNPDPNNPADAITADVYFGTTEPNVLYPNYGLTLAYEGITETTVAIPVTPQPSTTYYWVVDCHDPNEGLLPGPFWSFYVSGAPEIVTDPVGTAAFETQTAAFSTTFTTDDPVTSGWPKWYKAGETDEEMLNSDPDVTIETVYDSQSSQYTSTLTIVNLQASDEGAYYCELSNVNGITQTASAKLVVKRMIAYWPFDTDLNDVLNTYNGEAMGSPEYAAGKVGNAIVLDGTEDYITLPAGFDDFSAGMTISVWAYPTSVTSWGRFLDLGNTDPAEGTDDILFARNGTTNTLRFDFAPWPGAVDATDALALNEWQMFVVTMDEAGNVVIYKDGFPAATGTVASLPTIVTRTSNFIGKSNWAADALYAGMIDDMRIYNYGLTADDVADLYADVVGDYCRSKPAYDLTGDCRVNLDDFLYLAGYWLDCGFYPDPACQ